MTSTTMRLPSGELFTVKFIERKYSESNMAWNAATRVYVSAHDVIKTEWPVAADPAEYESPEFQKATKQANRQYVSEIKPYAEFALRLEELLGLLKLHQPLETYKLAWSRKAGCSCGCSPAFIVKDKNGHGVRLSANLCPIDVFVTVK